jgi:hypothetical protein
MVRNTIYFAGNATSSALWTLVGYALGGTIISLAAVAWRDRRTTPAPTPKTTNTPITAQS